MKSVEAIQVKVRSPEDSLEGAPGGSLARLIVAALLARVQAFTHLYRRYSSITSGTDLTIRNTCRAATPSVTVSSMALALGAGLASGIEED